MDTIVYHLGMSICLPPDLQSCYTGSLSSPNDSSRLFDPQMTNSMRLKVCDNHNSVNPWPKWSDYDDDDDDGGGG